MRDVYLSDPFERIASPAIEHGVLITRNEPKHAVRCPETRDFELLSRKLDEQKQQFLVQKKHQVETYVEEEVELSHLLPKEVRHELKKYVSLSLSHLEHYLHDLSVCDVQTEILHAWLDTDSSSSPSSAGQLPMDSYSARGTGNLSVSFEQQTELRRQACHNCLEKTAQALIQRLIDTDLTAIINRLADKVHP